MGFMNAEITEKRWWLAVDGNCGIDYIPTDLIDYQEAYVLVNSEEDDALEKLHALVRDYTENSKLDSAELIHGYGVRSSAAGYLDCTSWAVYTNKREAESAARKEQRECDGLE